MELYAAGLNAWNQLRFHSTESDVCDSEPEDISTFTCVLEDAHIERPQSWLSFTIGKGPIFHLDKYHPKSFHLSYRRHTTLLPTVTQQLWWPLSYLH